METNFQYKIVGTAFIGAPLLMLISDLIQWLSPGSIPWINSVIFWLSFYTYIAVVVGMVKLSGNTRGANVGAMLAILGALIGITIIGLGRVALSLDMHGMERELINEVISEPLVFFTSRAPGILFPVGFIILAFTMKKSGTFSTLSTILFLIGVILFPMGRIPRIIEFNVAGDLLMLAALAPVGLNLLKRNKPVTQTA